MRTRPGRPHPLGATWDGSGVNFALFSENATGVELCLFDGRDGEQEVARISVTEQTDQVWHVYLPEVRARASATDTACTAPTTRPGATASIRPSSCSTPMPRRSTGTIRWSDALFGTTIGHPDADLARDERDSAAEPAQVAW